MDRRAFLAATGLSVAALAGCNTPNASPGNETDGNGTSTPTTEPGSPSELTNPSFESGLDGWTVGRDLPADPNTDDPDDTVDSSVTTTTERASDGEAALAVTIDGSQDDGTVWVEQPVDLSGADTLAFDVYSPEASFNTRVKAAAYTGPSGELVEEDFDTTQAADGHEGWKTFEYDVSSEGGGVVAVGVSMVWETELTVPIDNVRLSGAE